MRRMQSFEGMSSLSMMSFWSSRGRLRSLEVIGVMNTVGIWDTELAHLKRPGDQHTVISISSVIER